MYKTERGLRGHLAGIHEVSGAEADDAVESSRKAAPPQSEPPSPGSLGVPPAPAFAPPGGPSYLGATSPGASSLLAPPPPPPTSASQSPAEWGYGGDPEATAQVPVVSQPWAASPTGGPGQPPLHLFRAIRPVAMAINRLFGLLLLALLVALAANVFLYIVFPSETPRWRDLAFDIDERMFLILPVQLVLYALIFIAVLVWLYRATANEVALGAERPRLGPSELLALCFVPVVNLFAIKVALADIWRTADPKLPAGDSWRKRSAPFRLNMVWIGPLLILAVNIGSAILVNNRIDDDGIDGVSTIAEVDFLYLRNALSVLVGLIMLNAIRRVFVEVTERQDSAFRQHRARPGGFMRGPQSPPPPPTAAPTPAPANASFAP